MAHADAPGRDGDRYTFPCGCSFPIDRGLPAVNGKPSLIYEVEKVPLDCPATWALISSGRTKGIFQLESSLGKTWAKRLKPENINHLAALVSLLRPGCLKARDERGVSMTELYCRRKNGEEPVEIDIEAVRDILEKTYDVIVFQEQFMQISQRVAGFNLVEVDRLRKAGGKKDVKAMNEVGEVFIEKAEKLGVITREEAERLFANIKKSARYSFNASHAVSYSFDSYWTAHEKAHFPVYFYTSYLYYAKEKQKPLDEIRALINDAKLADIEVLPPKLIDLEPNFYTDGVEIRFGLSDVKDVGEKTIQRVVKELPEVAERVGKDYTTWTWFEFLMYFADHMGARTVRRMIEVGAMGNFRAGRLRLLAEYTAWMALNPRERQLVAELHLDVEAEVPGPALEKYLASLPPDVAPEVVEETHEAGTVRVVLHRGTGPQGLEEAISLLLDRVTGYTKGTKSNPSRAKPAVTAGRREKVESLLRTLKNPPTPLVDRPDWIAKKEEESLGVAITCTNVEAADKSQVNTTCKELRGGKNEVNMVVAVEVQEVREIVIKNGKNRGRGMAYLVVSDETGALDDVTVFADAWEKYGNMLSRERTVVGLVGSRDRARGSFLVEKVFEV